MLFKAGNLILFTEQWEEKDNRKPKPLVTALSTSDLASKMLLKHRDGLMVELGELF